MTIKIPLKEIVLTIIIIAVITTLIYFFTTATFLSNLFPPFGYFSFNFSILFLFFALIMYSGSGFIRNKLYKPAKYLYPILIFLSFSFGFISLLFGMHTDILTAYDEVGSVEENSTKWFIPTEIINFPLFQVQRKDSPLLDSIRFNNTVGNDKTCHLVFIDKTCSIKSTNKETNRYIIEQIRKNFSFEPDHPLDNTADIIPLYILSEVYEISNQKYKDSMNGFGIFYYDGLKKAENSSCKSIFKKNTYTFNLSELTNLNNELINDYVEKISKVNIYCQLNTKKQETHIEDILSSTTNQISNLKNKYDNFCIYIISDFIDSAGKDNKNLQSTAASLREIGFIKSIKFYRLQGSDLATPNNKSPEYILNLLNKQFEEFNPCETVDLTNKNDIQLILKNIRTDNFSYKNAANDKLSFYYPYNEYNSDKSYKAYVKVTGEGDDNTSYNFKIIDIDNADVNSNFIYQINSNSPKLGIINNESEISLSAKDTLKLKINNPNQYINDRLAFHIISEGSRAKVFKFIKFLPRMPETTCYYLLTSYCFFIVSACLIFLYPVLLTLLLIHRKALLINHNWHKRFLYCEFIFGLVPIIYLFYAFRSYKYILVGYLIIILFLVSISFPPFCQAYLKKKKIILKKFETDPAEKLKYRYKIFEPFWKLHENH